MNPRRRGGRSSRGQIHPADAGSGDLHHDLPPTRGARGRAVGQLEGASDGDHASRLPEGSEEGLLEERQCEGRR